MLDVTSDVDQTYELAPLAVNVVEEPVIIDVADGDITIVGKGLTTAVITLE